MKKTLVAIAALTLLAGCGTPSVMVAPSATRAQLISAQSITSIQHLQSEVRAYFKTVFAKLDADKNGLLTKDETRASNLNDAGFDAADTSKNGKINVTEFVNYTAPHMTQVYHQQIATSFLDLDADGDMALSATELGDKGLVTFAAADTSKNGKVTFAEYEEAVGQAIAEGHLPGDAPAPATSSVTATRRF